MEPGYTVQRGVCLVVTDAIYRMLRIVAENFAYEGIPCIVSSGVEGAHGDESLHYSGKAVDVYTVFPDFHLQARWKAKRKTIVQRCMMQFREVKNPVRILDEGDHLHIEWGDQ